MVDELLAVRSILASHETVRQWALKFGQGFANQIRRRLSAAIDKWHMDVAVLTISGVKHWLWRAVGQNGTVLDILVQRRCDRQTRPPRVMITDKLASYGAAKREVVAPSSTGSTNSHQPTQRRERQMKRFESAGQVQRFLCSHDGIDNLFHLRRHQVHAPHYRAARTQAFQLRAEASGVAAAA